MPWFLLFCHWRLDHLNLFRSFGFRYSDFRVSQYRVKHGDFTGISNCNFLKEYI